METPAKLPTLGSMPRMLEACLVRAAVDPGFLEDLVGLRSWIEPQLPYPLSPDERRMLEVMPAGQIRMLASRVRIPAEKRAGLERMVGKRQGQSWFEWALVLALVGIVYTAAMTSAGGHMEGLFQSMATGTESINAIRAKMVSLSREGLPYAEAVRQFSASSGVEIRVEAPAVLNQQKPVTRPIRDMDLERALLFLSQDVAGVGYQIHVEVLSSVSVVVRFTPLR